MVLGVQGFDGRCALGVSARVVCFLFGEKGRKQIECPVFFSEFELMSQGKWQKMPVRSCFFSKNTLVTKEYACQ